MKSGSDSELNVGKSVQRKKANPYPQIRITPSMIKMTTRGERIARRSFCHHLAFFVFSGFISSLISVPDFSTGSELSQSSAWLGAGALTPASFLDSLNARFIEGVVNGRHVPEVPIIQS